MTNVPVSLEVLRQQAKDARDADIEHHCRRGEDPWDFLPELPSVDEQVVLMLRSETIDVHDLGPARSRAYHPAARPDDAKTFEYQLLRRIAMDRPALAGTVWTMLGRLNAA